MAPLPPARLLTFIATGDHLFSSMMPVIMRIRLSVPPPGAYGTTTSMVRLGYFACAAANVESATISAPRMILSMAGPPREPRDGSIAKILRGTMDELLYEVRDGVGYVTFNR